MEEAGEVLGEAREALARLRRDDTDGEALLSLRRAFHTLKGSGRMAGAQRMGEFAWQLERLLNGVRDGLYPATPAVVAAAAEALDLVPEMIREIRQRRPLAAGAERLAARAAALVEGRGRLPATVQASDRGGAEAAAADDAGAAAEAGPEPREVPARAEVEDEQTLMGAAMDPVLYQVFRQEAEGHLDVVSAFLEEAARGGMAAAPSDGLLRALHTLHGSARMAGVAPVAEVAGALEAYGKALRANQAVFPEEALTVLAEAVEAMRAAVDGLARGGAALPDVDGLVRRITVFENKERTSQVLRLEGLELPPEEDASSRRAVLEVFLDEAMELVQALEATLHQWSEQPAETRFAVELARDLRSLGEAAGLAGVAPMAALCRAMKGLLERAGGAGEAPDPALWGLLAEGIEALEAMTSAVQAGQDPEPQAELVARLEAFGGAPGAEGGPGDAAAGATEEAAEAAVPAQDAAGEGPPCPADDRGGETGARASAAVWDESTLILEVGEGAAAAEEAAEADDEAALLREVFLEEASEILGRAEEAMVGWRARPQDPEPAAQLRRELHTLKGGARMAGIAAVAELCHAAESLLDDLATRRGEEAPVREVLQEALDALAGMVETVWRGGSPAPAPDLLERVGRLHAAVRGEAETAPVEGAASGAPAQPAAAERQDAGAEEPAAKAEVGEGAAGPEPGADAGPDRPASGDEGAAAGGGVAVTATVGAERRQPVLPAYQGHDTVRVRATLIDELVGFAGEIGLYRARLVQQANALRAALGEMEATVGRLREQLRKLEIETEAQILYRYEREGGPGREDFDPLELDRFSTLQQLSRALAESTEDLVNLRGILDGLNREAETMLVQQGRVASALQEGLMRARMVPFAGLLPRMRRIVRQVAQELGRKADLRVAGAEVELDTTVIDRVVPALEHLLRNALAHGIEPPERRREAGKPETGVVSISLSRDGPDVVIRIADDGAGVDLEAVRRKAEALGLLPPGAQIPEADLAQLILESGLSTAQEVTQVSGRGVGMDVVVNQVRQLGGTFAIETVRGRGTAFTLRIPFTLAVNRALLLRAGDETYAVLLSGVVGIARMGAEELAPFVSGEREEFVYAGRGYRFHHLGSLVDGAGVAVPEGGAKLPVILVRAAQQQVALLVDAVLGAREVVVKSLGPQFHGVRGVLGATILADGEVVLIVDVAALVHRGAILRAREAAAQEVDERPVVYVVDDSITMRRVTGRLLERHGMRAVAARDGVEALARMRELHPDLVLLDIEMPRMDGYDVAAHMRADPGLATVPIVMVTSRTGDKHRQRALELGVDRYLGKPYQEAELLETVRELLEGRAPAADAGGGA
ncbi:Hpt domain-containing protein [Inmirania thermothiophila]|uniref:hybrid sensor histidine kinase/response regulator n=1 Tax=Inmirania thermothiophila TaxID=1750597 RepID=UPI002482B677|nr:Hpt domain-containing protein [Inmirania thermothiophila]